MELGKLGHCSAIMRHPIEIAATAGLFACALAYAAQMSAGQGLAQGGAPDWTHQDWTTQDAALTHDVVAVGQWAAQPLARCYAEELSVSGVGDGSAPARALACDGSTLQPAAG